MTSMRIISLDTREVHGTVLIRPDDSVWVCVSPRRWDFATWLWWWLCPHDKKVWTVVKTESGQEVRCRAIRISKKHVHLGTGAPKPEEPK